MEGVSKRVIVSKRKLKKGSRMVDDRIINVTLHGNLLEEVFENL